MFHRTAGLLVIQSTSHVHAKILYMRKGGEMSGKNTQDWGTMALCRRLGASTEGNVRRTVIIERRLFLEGLHAIKEYTYLRNKRRLLALSAWL